MWIWNKSNIKSNIRIIKSIERSDSAMKLLTHCVCCDSACIDRAFRQGRSEYEVQFYMLNHTTHKINHTANSECWMLSINLILKFKILRDWLVVMRNQDILIIQSIHLKFKFTFIFIDRIKLSRFLWLF